MRDAKSLEAGPRAWMGIGLVYLSGMLQGLTLVSFPASGTVLKSALGFTDAQYGAIFLPQVAFAVLGSIGGGTLARRMGLRSILVVAMLANALSQLFLAASTWAGDGGAFVTVMLGTASLGLGFGLSGAPLNSYPPRFFPAQRDSAVVALHSLLGLGLTLGPIAVAALVAANQWVGFPLALMGLSLAAALGASLVELPESGEAPEELGAAMATEAPPTGSRLFWLYVGIAVLYAFAEGTFSNWAVLYLHEARGVAESTAGLALSVFWGALVAGRLLTSALVLRIPPRTIWLVLPALMIAAFLVLPFAQGAAAGIALFALAGLGCSSFFPLTITLVSGAFPRHVAWVSSMMIAALMAGVGLGSFVFGPLRELLSFEQLYRLSAFYPALALGLALLTARGALPATAEGRA